MQRRASSIRDRGGTSATFPLHRRLTDGSATDMKTSEGLSLPAYPCRGLGGTVANQNQWIHGVEERGGGHTLRLTLVCKEVTLKFAVGVYTLLARTFIHEISSKASQCK